jgi:hypothetical protein
VQAYEDREDDQVRGAMTESEDDLSEGGPGENEYYHPKIKSDYTLNLTNVSHHL